MSKKEPVTLDNIGEKIDHLLDLNRATYFALASILAQLMHPDRDIEETITGSNSDTPIDKALEKIHKISGKANNLDFIEHPQPQRREP